MRIIILCPESLIPYANQLTLILGQGPADVNTFLDAIWMDSLGNRYSAASWEAGGEWLDLLSKPLVPPNWDHIIEHGEYARSKIVFDSVVSPDHITVITNARGPESLTEAGLSAQQ